MLYSAHILCGLNFALFFLMKNHKSVSLKTMRDTLKLFVCGSSLWSNWSNVTWCGRRVSR